MATTPDVLKWTSMTPAVNEIKAPNNFVFNLLYSGNRQLQSTETLEISYLKRGRKLAPFVKKNGSAIMVSGHNEEFAVVEPPHIRIKRNMQPSDLLNTRRAGTTIFIDESEQQQAIDEYMARELQNLSDDADEALEWLACNSLRGAVSYTSEDEASFVITYPRTATHDYDLPATEHWDEGSSNVRRDFMDVSRLINRDVSLAATDCIMGQEAAEAFLDNTAVQGILDNRNIDAGTLQMMEQFQDSGAIFLGRMFNGVRCWEYSRQVDNDGTLEDLIRPKYAEFVSNVPAAQFVTYYAAIADAEAIGEGETLRRERFAKSWVEKDPSVRVALLATNPLPMPRRPDATVSVKVVSG